MDNFSRDIETIRKRMEMLEIKNTRTEIKNDFKGIISRLNTAKERITKFKGKSVEIAQ